VVSASLTPRRQQGVAMCSVTCRTALYNPSWLICARSSVAVMLLALLACRSAAAVLTYEVHLDTRDDVLGVLKLLTAAEAAPHTWHCWFNTIIVSGVMCGVELVGMLAAHAAALAARCVWRWHCDVCT
jgi:hypothetical protein